MHNYIKKVNPMSSTSRIHPRYSRQIQNSNSLVDQVYQAIHDSIVSGRIHPGDPLPQVQLAEEMGVSARTVREALSRLVAEGLAESEPHHSVRVTRITIEDQEQLYRMRAEIEGMAFEEAAARITRKELERLKEIVDLASQTTDPESAPSAQIYNREFHWTIILASGKRQYIRMLDQIWKLMFTYFEGYELYDDHFTRRQEDVASHTAILAALEAHDGKGARRELEHHIRITFEGQRKQMADYLEQSLENGEGL